MSVDELVSLHDVYETLQSEHHTEKASYILQYLRQYAASNFDVIGPYFTSGAAMCVKFIIVSLFETYTVFTCTHLKPKQSFVMEQAQIFVLSNSGLGLDLEHLELPQSGSQLFLVHPKDFACTTDHTESYTLFPLPALLCTLG